METSTLKKLPPYPHRLQVGRRACTPMRRFPSPLAASSLSVGSGVGRGSPRRSEGLNLFPSPPHGVEVGRIWRRSCCHHVRGKCPKNGDTSRVNIARDCIIGAEVPSMGLRSVPHRLQADRHACTPLRRFPCPLAASSSGIGSDLNTSVVLNMEFPALSFRHPALVSR